MKYLLDTNICIYAMNRSSVQVLRKFSEYGAEALCINALIASELAYGVERSATALREQNRTRLTQFLQVMPILPYEADAIWPFAKERQRLKMLGTPIGDIDMLIASHALAQGLTLVTNNTREFERIDGLKLENWAA